MSSTSSSKPSIAGSSLLKTLLPQNAAKRASQIRPENALSPTSPLARGGERRPVDGENRRTRAEYDAPLAMLKLAVAVVAIGLADCVNPSLIGGELFVATGAHPRRETTAFTAAALLVTFVFGLALALGLGDLILSLVPKPGSTVKYALIAFAGIVLVVGGAGVWIRRKQLVSTKQSDDQPEQHRPAVLMGAGIAGLELLTAFPYFAAIAMIVGSGVSDVGKLSLLVLYCVIYTLPLIAITVVIAIMGERAERILRPVGDWLSAHWPGVVAPLTAAFGIGVLAFGIVQLSST